MQGLYTEMKFEKPSRIQAKTLPMILQPPYRSLIAQVPLRLGFQPLKVYASVFQLGFDTLTWHAGTQWQRENHMLHACHAQQSRSSPQSASGPVPVPNQVTGLPGLPPGSLWCLSRAAMMLMCLQGAGVSECDGPGENGEVHKYQGDLNDCYCILPQASRRFCYTVMRPVCWYMRLPACASYLLLRMVVS